MAETNNKSSVQEAPKLSYEQLKAYTDQLREQAKRVFQENQMLKQAINSRDIDYAFKCLDHVDLFSSDFIKQVVDRLEELLTPERPDTKEENEEEENNVEKEE